jgi:hypothetical protein
MSSRTEANVLSEQIRTSYHYSQNKTLIAKITYYYSPSKFKSHLEQTNINGEKNIKKKNI